VDTTKEALLKAMEAYFNGDARRINHAIRVTQYAEELLKSEAGDYPVVIGAAVLHDIGIHQAEKKYGSTSGKYHEIEGPPIARQILEELEFEQKQIEEVCEIIAHHHSPGKVSSKNFAIICDADWLVNLKDEYNIRDRDKLSKIIEKVFLTASGKAMAREVYLRGKAGRRLHDLNHGKACG
jgi:putative nucleotidyltransferase with HDIG domain